MKTRMLLVLVVIPLLPYAAEALPPTWTATGTPTATSTPTSNRPPPRARGKAVPNPATPGERVQLLDDGSSGGVAGRFWTQLGEPRVELMGFPPTFVAPFVEAPTTLSFSYSVCNYDSGCAVQVVDVAITATWCIGDCNADRVVTVAELLTLVNVALDQSVIDTCAAGDAGSDGRVEISEIIAAVDRALNGCPPAAPTPTVSPTVSPVPTLTPAGSENGTCYESAFCDPCDVYPCRPFIATHEFCCHLAHGQGVTFSWCPSGAFDPATRECTQCAHPCAGLPTETVMPTPTPTDSPTPTPTSCRAVIPVVAPVTSPTNQLQQTTIAASATHPASSTLAGPPAASRSTRFCPPEAVRCAAPINARPAWLA